MADVCVHMDDRTHCNDSCAVTANSLNLDFNAHKDSSLLHEDVQACTCWTVLTNISS